MRRSQIVAMTAPAHASEARCRTPHEAWATCWLTVGSLIPIAGWLVGVYLAWTSSVWTLRQKLAITLLLPGGLTGALWAVFALGGATSYSCLSGSAGTTEGLGGPVLSSTNLPQTCSAPVMPTWFGLLLAIGVVALALAVPLTNWFRLPRARLSGAPADRQLLVL